MSYDNNSAWFIEYLGVSPWYTLIIAFFTCALIIRLGRNEVDNKRQLLFISLCRCGAACLIILVLNEPSISSQYDETHKTHVAIIIDNSLSMEQQDTSMHAFYALNEAQALGFITPQQRPIYARQCAAILRQIVHTRKNIPSHSDETNIDSFKTYLEQLTAIHDNFIGHSALYQSVDKSINLCQQFINALSSGDEQALHNSNRACDALISAELLLRLHSIQMYSDAALVAGQKSSSSLSSGLAQFRDSSRQQRAIAYSTHFLFPQLSDSIQFSVRSLDNLTYDIGGVNNSSDTTANATDNKAFQFPAIESSNFHQALQSAHRDSDEQHTRAVIFLSDGIINGGSDPRPLARAFSARSIPIHSIRIGDPHLPRDAAILDIDAPNEAHQFDDITIGIRYRINGYPDMQWSLKLFVNNELIAQTRVQGNEHIQENNFSINASTERILHIRAALTAYNAYTDNDNSTQSTQTSINNNTNAKNVLKEEMWLFQQTPDAQAEKNTQSISAIPSTPSLNTFFSQPQLPAAHTHNTVRMSQLSHHKQEHFIRRLHGYISVAQTGDYTFWISANNSAQLWLSTDQRTEHLSLLAHLGTASKEKSWSEYPQQKSQTVHLKQGAFYAIEIRQQDHSLSDHLNLAWSHQDTAKPTLIEDRYFHNSIDTRNHPTAKEAHNANNIREHSIAIHSDPLQVLLIDAQPRWISRLLVLQLQKDQRVDIDHHYLIGSRSTATLPTDKKLNNYDIIILGDIDVSFLNTEDQKRISSAVQEQGVSLICIAGHQAMPHAYSLGPLADILPVHVRHAGDLQQQKQDAYILGTQTSLAHTCSNIWEQRRQDSVHMPKYPPIHWVNSSVAAKQHAHVHLIAQLDDQQQVPLIVSHHIGAGHVLYIGSDELWSMRRWLGSDLYQRWWESLIQWGSLHRLRGRDPRLQVSLSHGIADSGENIYIRARAHTNEGLDCSNTISVQVQSVQAQSMQTHNGTVKKTALQYTLHSNEESGNAWTAHLGKEQKLLPGQYRMTVSSSHPDLNNMNESRDIWIRKSNSQELNMLSSNSETLADIAHISGGLYRELESAQDIVQSLREQFPLRHAVKRQRSRIWHGYGALISILILLSLSWWYRKRIGLP